MKLLCLYCVMFQYRVGTYTAMSKLKDVDFELWHGRSVPNSKRKNYEGEVPFRHKELPTKYIPVPGNGTIGLPYTPFLFFRLLRYSPDVVLTEGASNLLWASIAFFYCKLFRKKIIWWSLGSLKNNEHKGGLRGLLQYWISYLERHVDAVFTYSSQGERYFLEEGVDESRVFKAINVIDTTEKIEKVKKQGVVEKESGFNIAFVGAMTKVKNLEVLVDAVRDLFTRYSDVHLHLIGDGNYKPVLEKYVKEKAQNVDVRFHGRVVDGLNSLLEKYQVLVLPGLGGLAIVDGMVSSLPVISGPADGTELDLINEENGFVISEKMTKDFLVEKLSYLHDNPEVVSKMGKRSFEKITHEFSFESYMSIFQNCLNYAYNEK